MPALQPTEQLKALFQPIRDAIAKHRAALTAIPDLVVARAGFRYDVDAATPAVVLAFMPPLRASATSIEQQYAALLGVPVLAVEAAPDDQIGYLSNLGAPLRTSEFDQLFRSTPVEFRPPLRGTYEEPDAADAPRLTEIDEPMALILATSPDAGWPMLQEFLAQPVQHRIQIGMYQFTAPHIYKQLRRTLLADDDAQLRMTLHPVPEKIRDEGTKADDIYGPDLLERLRRSLGSRFDYEWMSVGAQQVFASSYHIKVAIADSQRLWLSSGNWQSSNQPPFDPINEPENLPQDYLRSYNREHHVIIEHAGLASTFERYLEHDFRHGATTQAATFGSSPDLFVAAEPALPQAFAPPRYFEPLRLNRKVRVQPLLTPDNYARHVLTLLESAQHSIWLQNQYINLNPQGELPEFTELLSALLERAQAGLDVRIICRDLMKAEKLDLLVAIGFDPKMFRFLKNTHTKIIIVDGERTVIGSHNWSNEGVVSNRDASLLFFDQGISKYCGEIFLYDWGRARARIARHQPRVARDGEAPFPGAARLSWESVFDELPSVRSLVASSAVPVAPSAAAGGRTSFALPQSRMLTPGGVDGATGQYLFNPIPITAAAAQLRKQPPMLAPEARGLVNRLRYQAFGLRYGLQENNLAQVGWGIVVRQGDPGQLLAKIDALLRHRRTQAPREMVKVLEYRPGEELRDWLQRHNVSFGTVTPSKVPFHLMLLGGPKDIPFEFQYLLSLEYSVGRLCFDDPNAYARYANSVVRYETDVAPTTTRDAVFFAPQHAGDAATELSRTLLVDSLLKGSAEIPRLTDEFGFRVTPLLGADAKRAALLDALHGRSQRPALLFTAGHGMGFPAGHPRQVSTQGALLTQDWSGIGSIKETDYVAATDIKNDAQLHGLVAFLFACYGAGTPKLDSFPMDLEQPPIEIAADPFIAALPQRLLAHPNGGALGIYGHIERAWGFSINAGTMQPQLNPFWNAFARIISGACLGNATRDFNVRWASLSAELTDIIGRGTQTISDEDLVWRWIERNDARAYILLGDPGTRVRNSELH